MSEGGLRGNHVRIYGGWNFRPLDQQKLILRHLLELPERKVYRKIINQAILLEDSQHHCMPSDVSAMVAVMRNDNISG
jgi:hypothetical protein